MGYDGARTVDQLSLMFEFIFYKLSNLRLSIFLNFLILHQQEKHTIAKEPPKEPIAMKTIQR